MTELESPIYIEFLMHDAGVPEEVYDALAERLSLDKAAQQLADYRFPVYLKIGLSQPTEGQYRAAVWMRIGRKALFFTVGGENLDALAEALETALARETGRLVAEEKQAHRREQHRKLDEELEAYCALLEEYVDEGRPSDFMLLMSGLIDRLRGYVVRKIHDAYNRGRLVAPDAVDVEAVMDEITETLYKNFKHRPADKKLLHWIYEIIERVIERHVEEANEERTVHVTLEDLAMAELEDLDESHFVVDAEGEIYDLNDFYEVVENPYYPLYSYEDFWPLDEERPEAIDPHKLHIWVANKLARLAERQREVFDLYALEGMTESEIAEHLSMRKEEVKETLRTVREYLREQFRKEQAEVS